MLRWFGCALVALCGCSPGPEWPAVFPFEYRAGCFDVRSEIELDPAILQANEALLAPILTPVMGDPCVYRAPVHVLAVERWGEHDGVAPVSHYDLFAGITTGRLMEGWAHELLHARDMANLAVGTVWHEGWDRNGYQRAYEDFAAKSKNPALQPTTEP